MVTENTGSHKLKFSRQISWGLILASLALLLLLSYLVLESAEISASFARSSLFSSSEKEPAYTLTPEYDMTAELVVASLAPRSRTLSFHDELFRRLPEYSRIILLLPGSLEPTIAKALEGRPYQDRVELLTYQVHSQHHSRYYMLFPEKDKLIEVEAKPTEPIIPEGSIWARDLFVAGSEGQQKAVLLIPDTHKWYVSVENESTFQVTSDNHYLERLTQAGLQVKRLPFIFQGGNILVDRSSSGKRVFVGSNQLKTTRVVWKAMLDRNPSDDQLRDLFSQAFQADQLVILGSNRLQPPSLMFHIDQALVFLGNQTVGMTRLVKGKRSEASLDPEVLQTQNFLKTVRKQMLELGYRIIDLKTSIENLQNHQLPVNAIPFKDKETGDRKILFPRYTSATSPLDRELYAYNKKALERAGYQVLPVETQLDRINGGIHCLLNVIR